MRGRGRTVRGGLCRRWWSPCPRRALGPRRHRERPAFLGARWWAAMARSPSCCGWQDWPGARLAAGLVAHVTRGGEGLRDSCPDGAPLAPWRLAMLATAEQHRRRSRRRRLSCRFARTAPLRGATRRHGNAGGGLSAAGMALVMRSQLARLSRFPALRRVRPNGGVEAGLQAPLRTSGAKVAGYESTVAEPTESGAAEYPPAELAFRWSLCRPPPRVGPGVGPCASVRRSERHFRPVQRKSLARSGCAFSGRTRQRRC